MLLISDQPFNLIKYHIKSNLQTDNVLKTVFTNELKVLTDILLEGISYNEEGDICKITYIVLYTGPILHLDFKKNVNNTVYLIVNKIENYNTLFNADKAVKLNVTSLQYKYKINILQGILTNKAFDYFWSTYCVDKFNGNPYKWELEVKHLILLFGAKNKDKVNKELLTEIDLDKAYRKVSLDAELYLKHIFTKQSLDYLNNVNREELFSLFITGPKFKSPVLRCIELHNKELLFAFMCFKESFYKGYVRLYEGVYILDYIIHNYSFIDYYQTRQLFKLIK